jgi:tetratricopeptide (TPR) repeat protein
LRRAGDAARDSRDWGAAIRFYGKLVELSPTAYDIKVQLGHAFKETSRYTEAAVQYYSVLAVDLSDDDLHLQIGHLEKLRGNRSEAARHYLLASQANPQNLDAAREHWLLSPPDPPALPPTRSVQTSGSPATGSPPNQTYLVAVSLSVEDLRQATDEGRRRFEMARIRELTSKV